MVCNQCVKQVLRLEDSGSPSSVCHFMRSMSQKKL